MGKERDFCSLCGLPFLLVDRYPELPNACTGCVEKADEPLDQCPTCGRVTDVWYCNLCGEPVCDDCVHREHETKGCFYTTEEEQLPDYSVNTTVMYVPGGL